MKYVLLWVLVFGVTAMSSSAMAAEKSQEGPRSPSHSFDSNPFSTMSSKEILRNNRMQTWGYALLATGAIVTVGGIALVEALSYGMPGKIAFSTTGAGIGTMVVGMFLLGFSRPFHGQDSTRTVFFSPAERGQGGSFSIGGTFSVGSSGIHH